MEIAPGRCVQRPSMPYTLHSLKINLKSKNKTKTKTMQFWLIIVVINTLQCTTIKHIILVS